tara:strand:- start:803 stop:1108 length:306 start_codon:yes stop_codon:yes gene_type:complete
MSPYGREIMEACCEVYGITPKQFTSHRRLQHWAECRWMCWMILYRNGHATYMGLGEEFGGWDHGTVLHGVRRLEQLIPINKGARQKFNQVKHLLNKEEVEA